MNPPRIGKRALAVVLGLGAVGLVWLYCGQYEKEMARQARVLARADAQATAHILGGEEQTTVPFTLRHGWIIVRATLAGHSCDCFVDTGASYVQWSKALAVSGRSAGIGLSEYRPSHLDPARDADCLVLPKIRLGSYEVDDLVTVAFDHCKGDPSYLRMPTLGNDFFRGTALTIDYPARKLIIRLKPSDCPHTTSPHSCRAHVSWTREFLGPGKPTVVGSIAGLPARFLVDTGASPLGAALVGENLDAGLTLRNPFYRRTNMIGAEGFFDVPWSCAGVRGQGSIPYVPALEENAFDAVLGTQTLRNYRVTLDYRHSWIEFAPSPPSRTAAAKDDSAG